MDTKDVREVITIVVMAAIVVGLVVLIYNNL